MKTIEIDALDHKSIKKAIKEIEQYRRNLTQKCRLLTRMLARIGLETAEMVIGTRGEGDTPRDAVFEIKVSENGTSVEALLIGRGENLLFWEFGAGIRYNNGNANPYASKVGMGVGTYPGQRFAINPGFWYYKDADGSLHFSQGTQAVMPMYNATLQMIDRVGEAVAEVFGNG